MKWTASRDAPAWLPAVVLVMTCSCHIDTAYLGPADASEPVGSDASGFDANGVDSGGLDSGGLDASTDGDGIDAGSNPLVVPSNVPAGILASGTSSPGLASLGSRLTAAGVSSGDIVVIDTDDGGIDLFDASGGMMTTIRSPVTGEDNGIYFDTAAQTAGPELGIFFFTDFDLPVDVTVRADGDKALVVVATGCVALDGPVLAGAGAYTASEGGSFDLGTDGTGFTGGIGFAGPGGWDAACRACTGLGPGAGGIGVTSSGNDWSGGGGAGFGGTGGMGGMETDGNLVGGAGGSRYYCGGSAGTTPCAGAVDYNDTLSPLIGGASGGGGGDSGSGGAGGAGGGAVQLSALSACGVTLSATGGIDVGAEGGRGAGSSDGNSGGGGGAGGAILLEGTSVVVAGFLTANGGGGGGGDDGSGSGSRGTRGRIDAMAAAGGTPTSSAAAGGGGGAGTDLDGSAGGDEDDGPGGGGGALGRIRVNADMVNSGGSLLSPDSGTAAYTVGPTPN